MADTVAVLGGGPGGMALAAHLASQGHTVRVFELPGFAVNLKPIHTNGGIRLHCDLHGERLVPVALATTNVAEALAGADVVFCVVPCFGHRPMAELALPYLRTGQIFCFSGEGGGSLVFRHVQRSQKVETDVVVGEMNTLPFLARLKGPGVVSALAKPGGVLVAALPHSMTAALTARLKQYWPSIEPGETVFETVLLNFNAIDHVATVLTNIGTIEGRQTQMLLWGEGATPSVVRCIEGVDREIFAIRQALGLRRAEVFREWLAQEGFTDRVHDTLYEAIHQSALERSVFKCGPDGLRSRYITEDVPYALVLISSIGKALDVSTPLIDALVTIASTACSVDFWAEGRTLASVGILGYGRQSLLDAVT